MFQWLCGIYWFSGAFALLCDVDLISWRTTSPQSTSGQDVLPTGQFIIAFFSIVNLVVFKSLFLSFSVCKYNVRKINHHLFVSIKEKKLMKQIKT